MLIQDIAMKKSEDGLRESINKEFSAFAYEHSSEMMPLFKKYRRLTGRTVVKTAKNRAVK